MKSTNDMAQVSSFAVNSFDTKLVQGVFDRWAEASLVQDRKHILAMAMEAYKSGDYISPIYILLPQIEGLITKHVKRKGQSPEPFLKNRFRQFGDMIKYETFNTEMTRYLTNVLVSNLSNAFYKTGIHMRRVASVTKRPTCLHSETLSCTEK